MTSNGKQFTIIHKMLTAVTRDQKWPDVVAGILGRFSKFAFVLFCYKTNHLMTGPLGNSEFCVPRLRFSGNKIHCSPRNQSLSVNIASINDSCKFRAVPFERPSGKGRPPTYYHPLLTERERIRVHRTKNSTQAYCRYGPPYRFQINAFVWFTKDTQGSVGDGPHTIRKANIQLSFGKMT